MKRKVKVGVNVGGGPPPKYKWNVEYLKDARKETMGFLDAFEISSNLKLCQKVAIFKKYGTCIKRDKYVAQSPAESLSSWGPRKSCLVSTLVSFLK